MRIQTITHQIDFAIYHENDSILSRHLEYPMGPSFRYKLKIFFDNAPIEKITGVLINQAQHKR